MVKSSRIYRVGFYIHDNLVLTFDDLNEMSDKIIGATRAKVVSIHYVSTYTPIKYEDSFIKEGISVYESITNLDFFMFFLKKNMNLRDKKVLNLITSCIDKGVPYLFLRSTKEFVYEVFGWELAHVREEVYLTKINRPAVKEVTFRNKAKYKYKGKYKDRFYPSLYLGRSR